MSQYDDAVVGAGILGLAHAYHLAKSGRRVIVLERNSYAQGASIRNFGMLWPIGQPAGPMRQLALRSLEIWLQILPESGCWFDTCGSLHLAYREDELQILREFLTEEASIAQGCRLENPKQIAARSQIVNQNGLLAGMWSPTETCVDPREVIAKLPEWLLENLGVEFAFGQTVTGYSNGHVQTQGGAIKAHHLFACTGDEMHLLFPDAVQQIGLIKCKLQMMRSTPTSERIGPMLAGGLTLKHYGAFQNCPGLPSLKSRICREAPEFDRYGIHVMASQNGNGEIVIGDSHEYGDDIEPFDKPEIDRMILEYLGSFAHFGNLKIAQRWHGVYAKHPSKPYTVVHPQDSVTIVTGVGGAGMTLSFGIAERVVEGYLGAASA